MTLFTSAVAMALILFPSSPAFSEEETIIFIAAGDVMLGRNIGKTMEQMPHIDPFKHFTTTFNSADVVFANLESILGDEKSKLRFPEKPYNFITSLSQVKRLKKAGFNVISLANNHAMDYGLASLLKTHSALRNASIISFGGGKNLNEARKPAKINIKGVTFGFLGYSNGHSNRIYAKKNSPGTAPLNIKMIMEDVDSLRKRVDIVVVSLHWGIEYENQPTEKQRVMAHRIIDGGADIILGHHPHVMQGVELYKDKLIAYSLGNFLFDQDHHDTKRSFILLCTIKNGKIDSFETIPITRFNTFYPKPAKGKKKKEILNYLEKISAPLNKLPRL